MNNISWRGIRAFIVVVEHGSFTAAAQASGFSKANLSQLITDLEKALRVQLLHRTTRQLRLTEVGEGYYQRCKKAMTELDTAAEWVAQSTDNIKGVIRMNSVGGILGEELIAPLIMRFQQHYPDVQVHLDFSSIREDLIESHYDLVIRMGELPDSSLVARKICTATTRYVASPEFLKQNKKLTEPSHLNDLSLIYGSVSNWVMNRGREQYVVNIEQGIKIISGRVMHKAALSGLGVTRLADVYCQSDIKNGHLVEVLPDWAEQTPISIVCPPNRHQLNRVRVLMSWIADNFNDAYQNILHSGAYKT